MTAVARGNGSRPRSDRLWAVCCYFNPSGYHNRSANYRTFAESLSPLVTVELSFGATFELGPGDASILIQIKGADVLWQKERLLNLAVAALPAHCDAVACLDADVVFERDDWAERSRALLENVPLVQPFADFCDLALQSDPDQFRRGVDAFSGRSFAAMVHSGCAPQELLQSGGPRLRPTPHAGGFAWVARRSLLGRHSLYDACVVGSGDRAMLTAAFGVPELSIRSLHMNETRARHYLSWAWPFFKEVRGRIGFVSGAIYHLWHGKLGDRRYQERHVEFSKFAFCPDEDIHLDENACWAWSSDKPDMHQSLTPSPCGSIKLPQAAFVTAARAGTVEPAQRCVL